MWKRLCCFILILSFVQPSFVRAQEEASVLLKKYNVPYYDPVVESKKLKLLEDEFNTVSYKVNTQTMLESAIELNDLLAKQALKKMDAEIYSLNEQLYETEALMEAGQDREVAYIMELDSRYRFALGQLNLKQQERKSWMEQEKGVSNVQVEAAAEERKKLEAISPQLEQQRTIYKKAASCPVLGEVSKFKSPLAIPVQLTSSYGQRLDPVTQDAITFHHGMDMHAPMGTAVFAAFNGKVEEASSTSELGNYVVINHGCGIKTLYGHLESYHVAPGEKVAQYDTIASSGNTGSRTTGPHLHFGVYINGKSVDPGVFVPH